jgi:hypothetical protein
MVHLVSDEGADIALPSREWELLHDNVMLNKTIVVRTSTGGTGITITDFTTQSGSKPWKTKLVFGSTVNAGRYYITYYSQGDQNDADDLNTLAGSVNELVQTIGPFSGIQTELDAIQQSVNKVESEVNINSVLQKSVDTVQSTVSVIPTVQSSILNAITGLKTDVDSTIAKEQTLNSSIATLQSSIISMENVQSTIIDSLNQLGNKIQSLIDMGGVGGGIGNTAPNISSTFAITSVLTTDSISIPYIAYDSEDTNLTVSYVKDGIITTASISTGSNTWDVGTLSVGDHTLSIWVKDSGNLTSNTLTFNISVATANTAPVITSSYNPIAVNDKTSVAIPYTVTDVQGGTLTATYTKDGVSSTSAISTGSNTWNVGTLGIGNHTLTIKVKDDGNLTSNTLTFNISVVSSNGAPTISSTFSTTSVNSITSISIPYTIDDADDSTFTATYTVDSSSTVSTVTGTSATWNVGTLPVGSHTLAIQVKDSGNLSSNTLTFNITVTAINTAPSISSSFTTNAVLTTDSVSIPYTITDAQGGSMTATYTKDGVPSTSTVATGSNTWNVGTLTAGSHTLSIQVKDSGNMTSNTLTFNITASVLADTTPPQPVSSLIASTPSENSITVSWALSPSGDVANYEVAYAANTASPSYVIASNVINPSSTSYTITGLSPDTDYIIRVVAIDTSGNRSTPVTATKVTGDGITGGAVFNDTTFNATISGGTFSDTVFSLTRDGGVFAVQTVGGTDGGAFGDTVTSSVDGGAFGGTNTDSLDGGTF